VPRAHATYIISPVARPATPHPARRILALGTALAALTVACYEVASAPVRPLVLELPDTATADGTSLTAVAVAIDTATTPADKRTVTITTSAGVFATSGTATATAEPDQAGVARTLLRAPADSTAAIVSAAVNGITTTGIITFRRAMPDAVDLAPTQLTLVAGSTHEITVTATLRRTVGQPSPAIRITFTSADTTSAHGARGIFLPATTVSDAKGVATARFTIADTSYHGPLTLRATAAPAGVSGDATVQILAP
jgi:hypothetical protein